MLQNNHSLARPCPSCGAPLRVHSGRLTQKMQCPKCLDTIMLEPADTPKMPPKRHAQKKATPRKKSSPGAPSAPVPIPADTDLAQRYAELLLQHAGLAERYAKIVTDFDALVARHAELTQRMLQLGEPD